VECKPTFLDKLGLDFMENRTVTCTHHHNASDRSPRKTSAKAQDTKCRLQLVGGFLGIGDAINKGQHPLFPTGSSVSAGMLRELKRCALEFNDHNPSTPVDPNTIQRCFDLKVRQRHLLDDTVVPPAGFRDSGNTTGKTTTTDGRRGAMAHGIHSYLELCSDTSDSSLCQSLKERQCPIVHFVSWR